MKSEMQIFDEMQARTAPRFKRLQSDTFHAVHLVKPEGSQFWYYWNYDEVKWDTYYSDLAVTITRQMIGFKGDQNITVLVHKANKQVG